MKSIILVASGGALGSVIRYLISLWVNQNYNSAFPWSTLFVNISGCIIIGALYGMSQGNPSYDLIRLLVMVGFLGGYTTFSSFGLESMSMMKSGSYVNAFAYIILTNILSLGGVFVGFSVSNRFLS